MALPPPPMAPPAPGGPLGAPGGMPPPAPDDDTGGGDTVVCTITKGADGGYTVYAGDEPDNDDQGGGMSDADTQAMGPGGDMAAPQGVPAAGVGEALKAVMDVLKADASSEGAPGTAEDQLAAGFGGAGGAGAPAGP